MDFKDPSYKVKNTFVEFSLPEDNESGTGRKQHTRSDVADLRHSPLVLAAKSPVGSPSLQPVKETMQAMPIDEVNFELLEEAAPVGSDPSMPSRSRLYSDSEQPVAQGTPGLGRNEPAYVVPTTPSPFLHSAFAPSVPPFNSYGYGMPDMGLPPAYGTEGEAAQTGDGTFFGQEMDCQFMHDVDGQFLQGMQYLPEMYDPNYGPYMSYGWAAVPVETAPGYGEQAPGPAPSEVMASSNTAEGFMDAFQALAPQERPAPSPRSEVPQESHEKPTKEGGRRGKGRNREAKEEDKTDKSAKVVATGTTTSTASGNTSHAAGASSSSPAPVEKISEGKGEELEKPSVYTTVMLRNIPNKYTREMLIKQLCIDYKGLFDFIYLPIDFKNKCNVGYAFINFRTFATCDRFINAFHGVEVRKCLPGLNSKKVVEVTPARVQGLAENVRRLRNSPVMNQLQDHPEWMPLLFNENSEEEPFPSPDQPLPPVKPRGRNREAKSTGNEDAA